MHSVGVKEFFAGKSIFITGATGFMGKVLVEKLLRSCPDIKTIFILVRKKKGQSPEARLETFTHSRLFEKLLAEQPKALNKLRVVSGDILEDDLGLSIKDEEELQRECQIVFNNAACVSFNLILRNAVEMNTLGTQKVLKLAEKMKKLEVFVHVSTSFCYDHIEVLDEKVYPSKHDPQDIINMLKWMDDKTVAVLQPELIRPYPNTYGYSKCLTEQLVSQYAGKFPIAIARPSIVLPTYKEPMPGWVDNINGPTGVIYAASRGVMHTMYCKDSTLIDVVPVDLAINAFILLAYFTGLEKPKSVRVCNVTQSGHNAITWIQGSGYCFQKMVLFYRNEIKKITPKKFNFLRMKYLEEFPLSFMLWYPVATGKNYKYQHKIQEFFTHFLPAYFIDLILYLLGKKTFMVGIINRLTLGLEVLEYYVNKDWTFKNDYCMSLQHQITEEEREIFYTDIYAVDVPMFMRNYIKGIREFYCKEDPSTLPQARKLRKRLYYLHVATKYAFYALVIYFLYSIFIRFYPYF